MANLIPHTQTSTLKHRRMVGVLLVGSGVFILSASALTLALLPAYFNVRSERIAYESALSSLGLSQEDGSRADRDALVSVRKRIDALELIGKKQKITEAVALVIKDRPQGITLRSLVYAKKDNIGTLTASGNVSDYAVLKAYADTLRDRKIFGSVVVPLTALANIEGGTFSISMTGDF